MIHCFGLELTIRAHYSYAHDIARNGFIVDGTYPLLGLVAKSAVSKMELRCSPIAFSAHGDRPLSAFHGQDTYA